MFLECAVCIINILRLCWEAREHLTLLTNRNLVWSQKCLWFTVTLKTRYHTPPCTAHALVNITNNRLQCLGLYLCPLLWQKMKSWLVCQWQCRPTQHCSVERAADQCILFILIINIYFCCPTVAHKGRGDISTQVREGLVEQCFQLHLSSGIFSKQLEKIPRCISTSNNIVK